MAQCILTERIVIEKFKERAKDEDGNLIDVFEYYYPCWANFKALSGKKFAEQQATKYTRVDSFTIRYCKKASELLVSDLENYRINFKGRNYTIKYPYDIKNEHNFIDLECVLIE